MVKFTNLVSLLQLTVCFLAFFPFLLLCWPYLYVSLTAYGIGLAVCGFYSDLVLVDDDDDSVEDPLKNAS